MNVVARSSGISLLTDARITISLKTPIKIQPDALICDLCTCLGAPDFRLEAQPRTWKGQAQYNRNMPVCEL